MNYILEAKDFCISIANKKIVHNVNFALPAGKNLILRGANGSGKSSLVRAIAGYPEYQTEGDLVFYGENINKFNISKRAQKGIFLSYQEPVEIPGLSYAEMLRAATAAIKKKNSLNDFRLRLAKNLELLELDPFFAQKKIGDDLSGGEKKKMEVLQVLMLEPSLAILDEIDSGLDKKSTALISKILNNYQKQSGTSFIIITHNNKILESLKSDLVFEIKNGQFIHGE